MSWSATVRHIMSIVKTEGYVSVRLVQDNLRCDPPVAWGYLVQMVQEGWLIGWEGTRFGEPVEDGVPLSGGPKKSPNIMDLIRSDVSPTVTELVSYTGWSKEAVMRKLKGMIDRGEVVSAVTRRGPGRPVTTYGVPRK